MTTQSSPQLACMLGRYGPCPRPADRLVSRVDAAHPGRYVELALCSVCATTLHQMTDSGAWDRRIASDQPLPL